jgi:hypothetical protein
MAQYMMCKCIVARPPQPTAKWNPDVIPGWG